MIKRTLNHSVLFLCKKKGSDRIGTYLGEIGKNHIEIYLSELGKNGTRFAFPSLPESIETKGNTEYRTYNLIQKGTVGIPNGSDVQEYSFSGVFFGKSKRKEVLVTEWNAPKECKKILNDWKEKGTVLRFMVTGLGINKDVTIASFSGKEIGAYGNFEYSISFHAYEDIIIYNTSDKRKSKKNNTRARPSSKTPSNQGNYTVKQGDNLWRIAFQKLGKSSRWEEIYKLNKETIEAAAKKHGKKSSDHGHWIYPGEKLKLPSS